jgi:fatty acid desaturase
MIRICRASEIGGRALLHFRPGAAQLGGRRHGLANAKILDNMEIGHNVMHGQYDWTGDPALNSQNLRMGHCLRRRAMAALAQRHPPHLHQHPGQGPRPGLLAAAHDRRAALEAAPLVPAAGQPDAGLGFQYGVGSHDLEIGKYTHGAMPKAEFKARLDRFLSKVGKAVVQGLPAVPGAGVVERAAGAGRQFCANLIRNLWTYVIIFCGHFTDGVAIYREEDTRNETRGDWYLRQLSGSSNLTGGRFFHIMSGHLSHQIEHHLFPDMPAHRYPEVAPKIQALCEKYGLFYNTGGLFKQYLSVMKRILTHTLPPRRTAPAPV